MERIDMRAGSNQRATEPSRGPAGGFWFFFGYYVPPAMLAERDRRMR